MNSLKIIALNANSIVSVARRLNLLKFLERHTPDILMLNETKLNYRHIITFKKYNVVRNDRPNSQFGGGTAILLDCNLKYQHVQLNELHNGKGIESTIIKLKLKNDKQLYIISVYCSGSNTVATDTQFEKDWNLIFETLELHKENNYYVIAGDLNARHTNWGNAVNNTRGTKLNRWLRDKELEYKATLYKPDAPTFQRSGNILDLAVIDNRLIIDTNIQGEIASHTYDGDHKAIEITCKNVEQREINLIDEHRQIFNFNNMNWSIWSNKLLNKYKQHLRISGQQAIIPSDRNLTDSEIEAYIKSITDLITQNIKTNAPKIRRKNNMECYTNNIIERLYKHKSGIITSLKTLKRKGCNNVYQINLLKAEIRRTNELIIQNIKMEVNKYWRLRLEAIKPGSKMFANMKRIKQSKAEGNIHPLNIEESDVANINFIDWTKIPKRGTAYISSNNQQNLNILGHFIEKHTYRNITLGKTAHELVIQQKIQPILQTHSLNKAKHCTKLEFCDTNRAYAPYYPIDDNFFISTLELTNILKCSNNKKSYGMDNIPSIVLKHLPEQIIRELCTIFNNLLNNRSFPDCWKTARIFPIKKKNLDPSLPESYRPISLLSNLGKIYEIIIYNKLQEHTNKNNLIPDNQFGFRYGHSTIHAITKLTSDICYKLNNKICTGAVAIDMKAAFESVWLDGLLFKLLKMNFHVDIIHLLHDMLYNRKFVTTNGIDISTKIFNLHNGLQQGSITAPLLFSLYTADLIATENMNSQQIQTIAYADDIVIYSADPKISVIQANLQKTVNFITDFLNTWRIELNPGKCETILFRKPVQIATNDTSKNWKNFKIMVNNTTIEQKPIIKYLGINIDRFCYINEHINIQLAKARKAFISNKQIFFSKHINTNVKEICYKALIRPIITYGCQIWYNTCPSYMEKIRIFERRCIRHCRGVFRKADTGYQHYVPNQAQYDHFKADRIDIHIIQLIRNHILRTSANFSNSLLFGPYFTDNHILNNSTLPNKIPGPEAFIYLDKKGYIQNENNLPIIYHIYRRPNEKGFDNTKFEQPENHMRFSAAFKWNEKHNYQKRKAKYWWLQ